MDALDDVMEQEGLGGSLSVEEVAQMNTLHREITNQIVTDFYDQPIMSNLARPHYTERMIILGLGDEWKLVSANWSGWDIESRDGIGVEVKQSAARQGLG